MDKDMLTKDDFDELKRKLHSAEHWIGIWFMKLLIGHKTRLTKYQFISYICDINEAYIRANNHPYCKHKFNMSLEPDAFLKVANEFAENNSHLFLNDKEIPNTPEIKIIKESY